MMDFKTQLSNVAFGGAWSEALVAQDELQNIMDVLQRAADDCAERDVNDRDFLHALRYVRAEIEKGPMLVEGLQKALLEPHPALRAQAVQRYVAMIREWAGL